MAGNPRCGGHFSSERGRTGATEQRREQQQLQRLPRGGEEDEPEEDDALLQLPAQEEPTEEHGPQHQHLLQALQQVNQPQ